MSRRKSQLEEEDENNLLNNDKIAPLLDDDGIN